MNLGAVEVQIFVSFSLVLGAILVAFVCDFLKGNNESLRERNIELRVRQEERERYQEDVARQAPRAIEVPAPQASLATADQPSRQPFEAAVWANLEELDEAEEIASKIRSRVQPEKSADVTEAKKPEEKSQLERPVIDQPAPASPPLTIHAKVTPIDRIALERSSATEAMRLAEELANAARITTDAVEEFSEESEDATELAEEIEEVVRQVEDVAGLSPVLPAEETEELIEEESKRAAVESSLSRGMLTADEFRTLADRTRKFRGAVVAIGVNGRNGASKEERQADMLMASLLNRDSLGCRIAEDEYILVFPGEDGDAGQRRFQQISQRLWDHQIRSVASGSITFSWGAMETSRMSLGATVASARERLDQTRRHRGHAPSQMQNFRLINS